MKLNLKLLLKSLYSKKTIIYVCIPMACCFIIALFINLLYLDMAKSKVIEDFSSKLDHATSQLDKVYANSVASINFLSEDSNVRKLLQDRKNSLSDAEKRELTQAVSTTFGNFIEVQDIYDDITLYLRRNKTVVSRQGVYSSDVFFNFLHKYSSYPKDFFDEFKSDPVRYKLLNITNVSKGNANNSSAAIPFVWQEIEGPPNGALIVLDIEMKKIIARLYESDLPAGGHIFISDALNNIYTMEDSDTEAANNIISKGLAPEKLHTVSISGKNYFIYSKRSEVAPFNSLTYTIYADSSQILSSLHKFNQLMNAFMLVAFIVTVLIIYIMISRLYSPLNMFFSQTDDYIKTRGISTDKAEHDSVSSMAQNYFFSHLLIWDNFYSPDNVENILANLKLKLPHNKFIVIIIKYLFTPEYNELFSSDTNDIISRLNSIMTAILPESTYSYSVQLEVNQLCVIVNCNDLITSEVIKSTYTEFSESLTYDREYINIQVAISRERYRLEDLHNAYLDAKNSLQLLTPFQYNEVTIYGEYASLQHYNLSAKTEESLFSALTSRNKEKSLSILESIFTDNKATIQPSFKLLCLRIYSIFTKVLEGRNITPQALMDENYININILIYELSPESIWRYIIDFCEKLTGINVRYSKTIEIDSVINYIEENYADPNLSLASLADYFDVTEKYISKFIIEKSGINFYTHLSRFRIEMAKKLLQQTDVKVKDLLKKTGFVNRNTFLRTFKKFTGSTPSEYRDSF